MNMQFSIIAYLFNGYGDVVKNICLYMIGNWKLQHIERFQREDIHSSHNHAKCFLVFNIL